MDLLKYTIKTAICGAVLVVFAGCDAGIDNGARGGLQVILLVFDR